MCWGHEGVSAKFEGLKSHGVYSLTAEFEKECLENPQIFGNTTTRGSAKMSLEKIKIIPRKQ